MTLAYDESSAAGALAVCLPWFGTSRVMTRAALGPAFAGSGVRLLYPDLPGHGDSPALDRATSEAVLDEVVRFLELHAQGPVLLAGCSYGGYLAATIARRRPDLVQGLLLVCPGVRRIRDLPAMSELPTERGWLDAAPDHLRDHLTLALGKRTASIVQQVAAGLSAGGPGKEDYQEALQTGEGYFFPDDEDSRPYEGPVAVVAGRQDHIVGFADQFRQMRHYPRGTFTAADLAGHYLPYEQPDLLRSVTLDWLQRCAS